MQNQGEEPSAYLQRLQIMLNTTFRRGGIPAGDLDWQLLKQFIRGCWDNNLISELQLEQKRQNPPTFAELLLLLCTAEDKQISKASCMKQHLSASKPKAYSHYQGASVLSWGDCTLSPVAVDSKSEIQDLKKQIADLQTQLTRLTQKGSRRDTKKPHPELAAPKPPGDNPRSQKLQPCGQNMENSSGNRQNSGTASDVERMGT